MNIAEDFLEETCTKNINAFQHGNVKEFAIDKSKLKLIAAYGLPIKDQHTQGIMASGAF